ncbi:MAGE-like protein 2 [Frieseomelitta varia]|uniref:MAGE-like protein 2 n=1 Tax=Frieseomelitta varia TaxID=561572 RepID=UPI001CB6AE51|nr:MAGE-like protein 2 [Frieseomelitta varia]
MEKIIVILTIVASCWASELEFGGYGLTLGEIAVDHEEEGFGLGELGGSEHEISLASHGKGGHYIPVVKTIGIPVAKKVPLFIPSLQIEKVPQNYPVPVIVKKPVPYQVEKQVFTKVEKKVPTPIEKIIPVKIEKPVPFHVVKHIPVPVVKPIPIKIPIHKTIVHSHKGH